MKVLRSRFYIRIFTAFLMSAGFLLIKLGADDYWEHQTIKELKDRYDGIDRLRNKMIHDDEELTMLARLAAATGDVQWETRFNAYEVELAEVIHQAIKLSPQVFRETMDRRRTHTFQLLDMERKAFALIHTGHAKAAMDILFGKQYGREKLAYTAALEKLNNLLKEQMQSALTVAQTKKDIDEISFISVLCLLLLSWLIIKRMTRQIQEDLMESNRQLLERTQQLAGMAEENKRLFKEAEAQHGQLKLAYCKLEDLYDIQKEFSTTLSHELRTPLATIKAALDIVISGVVPGELNDQHKDFLSRAKSNVDRLNRLINDMLDLAHLESGKTALQKSPCAINKIIQGVVHDQESIICAKGLYLRASLQEPIPELFLDQDKIIQVLNNLINNAVRFTDSGGIIVSSHFDDKEDQVAVRVTDTGCGIAQEDQGKLFEKFKQLGDPHQRHAGTGLGLAICKEIIRQHGGKVSVESAIGAGSCFYFLLPVNGKALTA